jgi:hypothetical protein
MPGSLDHWDKERGVKETTSYMRLFDHIHFFGMDGNLLPLGDQMNREVPKQDRIVCDVSAPVRTSEYLDESNRLFDLQSKETDFDQFNVDRVMGSIGQYEAVV